MGSGKEYSVEKQDVRYDDFIRSLYNKGKTAIGTMLFETENFFIVIDDKHQTFTYGTHFIN